MPQYPVSDQQGIVDGLNYLLSGPSGLGQSFDGSYQNGLLTPQAASMTQAESWVTGNLGNEIVINGIKADPATVNRYKDILAPTDFYYPGISTLPAGLTITAITAVTDTVIEITYTPTVLTNYTQTPFVNNQRVTISGVTPSVYNQTYTVVNYAEPEQFGAPSFSVELMADSANTWTAYTSGGIATVNAEFTNTQYQRIPTAAQAFVTVNGTDQRVFLSAQAEIDFYTYVKFVDIAPYQPIGYVTINRYRAINTTTLPDNYGGSLIYKGDYGDSAQRIYQGKVWQFDREVVSKSFLIDWDVLGTEVKVNQLGLQIFNNVIDVPTTGYYWYVLEIAMYSNRDPAPNDGAELPIGIRFQNTLSFSAQVVKQ